MGLLVICMLAISTLMAQQEPMYSQYRLNGFLINPAVAGTQVSHELRINTRQQWQSFPGAPRTHTLSYHGRTDEKSGVGAILFSDATGPTLRTGIQIAYAYRMPVGESGKLGQNTLSFGFAGKMIQYRLRTERIAFVQANDPAAVGAGQGITLSDASFGAYWYNDRFFAGISAPNLIQTNFGSYLSTTSNAALLSQLYRHYFFMAGYRVEYESFSMEPSLLVKKTTGAPYQIEGTMKWFLANEQIILGIGYRTDWLFTSFFAYQGNAFILAYSADFMLTQSRTVGTTFGPSHEFTLGLDLGRTWSQMYRGEE